MLNQRNDGLGDGALFVGVDDDDGGLVLGVEIAKGQGDVLRCPGPFAVRVGHADDHWNMGALTHEAEDAPGIAEVLGPMGGYKQDVGMGLADEDVPHEVKARLTGGAVEVQGHVRGKLQAAKVEGYSGGALHQGSFVGGGAIRIDDFDFADGADEGGFSGSDGAGDHKTHDFHGRPLSS